MTTIDAYSRRLVKSIAARVGLDVSRRPLGLHPSLSPFDLRRRRLLADSHINVVVDVGANAGQFGRVIRLSSYAGHIISIEPLLDAYVQLERLAGCDPEWTSIRAAAGSHPGTSVINVARNSWSSSFLPMTDLLVRAAPDSAYLSHEEVRVDRVDNLIAQHLRIDSRVYLKLDVQGFELQALAGAERLLEQTPLLELELSLAPLYENAPSHVDVLEAMDDAGYHIVAVAEEFVDPRTGHALQLNAIALRGAQPRD